jgi:hypothetical protein
LRDFWKRHEKLHLWLLTDAVLLAAFFLTRGNRTWMTALVAHVVAPLRQALGVLCARTEVCVAEVACVLLAAFAVWYVIWSVVAVIGARGRRAQRTYSAVLGAVCVAATIYAACCFLWGVQYSTPTFQEQSGIYAEEVSQEDLAAVTRYFAARLTETADAVPRNAAGCFDGDAAEILSESVTVYDGLEQTYPFLTFDDLPPKAVRLSRVMSLLDFTGVYCPYTGESCLNVDSPACMLPATTAHELAHRRGIASEQECNFLAILSSTTCGRADYAYSGWLLGYIHLGNALYAADQTAWQEVYDSLPAGARADLDDNNAYWAQFRNSPAKKVSNRVYDSFLKGYGEEQGLKSYGTVVDLLVAYYKDAAK